MAMKKYILYKVGGRVLYRTLNKTDYIENESFESIDNLPKGDLKYYSNASDLYLPSRFKRVSNPGDSDIVIWGATKSSLHYSIQIPSKPFLNQLSRELNVVGLSVGDTIIVPSYIASTTAAIDSLGDDPSIKKVWMEGCYFPGKKVFHEWDVNFIENEGASIDHGMYQDIKSMLKSNDKNLAYGIIESCDIRKSAFVLLKLLIDNSEIAVATNKIRTIYHTLLRCTLHDSVVDYIDNIIPEGYKHRTYGADKAIEVICKTFPNFTTDEYNSIYKRILKKIKNESEDDNLNIEFK